MDIALISTKLDSNVIPVAASFNDQHFLQYNHANTSFQWAAAGGGGGGLSFTPNLGNIYRGGTNRTNILTLWSGSYTTNAQIFDDYLANQTVSGWGTGDLAFMFNDGVARSINKFTIWINGGSTGSNSDCFRQITLKIYGSNNAINSSNGTCVDLNNHTTSGSVWLVEAIACKSYICSQYSQMYPQGWTFRATSNMNNYKCHKLKCTGGSGFNTSYGLYDVTFDYKKIHEVDYT